MRTEAGLFVVDSNMRNNSSCFTVRTDYSFVGTGLLSSEMFGMGGAETKNTQTVVLDESGSLNLGKVFKVFAEER